VLTGNLSFTIGAGTNGQPKSLVFCQNATGNFTVTPPSNMRGFFPLGIGQVASKCSAQHYVYSVPLTAWIADSTGVKDE
jgi:hypothetical protein